MLFFLLFIFILPSGHAWATQDNFKLDDVKFVGCGNITGHISNSDTRDFRHVNFRLRILDRDGEFINFISIVMDDFRRSSKRLFSERLMSCYPADCTFQLEVKELY
jgi:hypothetical protein